MTEDEREREAIVRWLEMAAHVHATSGSTEWCNAFLHAADAFRAKVHLQETGNE